MKHTYLLLITAFVLFIPSINLDASQAKKNDAKKLQSKSVTLAKKKRPIGKKKPSSPQTKGPSEIFATFWLGTSTNEDTPVAPKPPSQNTDKKSEQPNSSDQDDELSAESDSGTPVSPQNLTEQDLFEDPEIIDKKPTMDEIHQKEAIDFCRSEEDGMFSDEALAACLNQIFNQVSNKTTTPDKSATAKQEITDGLRKLLKKNENDLEKITKLTSDLLELDGAKGQLKKTAFLIEVKKILEQVEKRLRVGHLIINNENENVQLNEVDLRNYIKAGQDYNKQLIMIAGIELDFGLTNLERLDKIGARIDKKSLKPSKIGYEPLDFKKIIDQLTDRTNNDVKYGIVSDDGNDSDIDDETQTICKEYSPSWFFSDTVERALTLASKSTINKDKDTIVIRDLSFGLQELLRKNSARWKEIEQSTSTKSTDNEVQSEIIRLQNSSETQKNLELARFIIKTKIAGIQFDENGLLDLYASCQKNRDEETQDLERVMLLLQNRIQRTEEMCHDAQLKSLRPEDIDYDPIDTSRHAIFQSAMQSLPKLNAEASAKKSAKELTALSVMIL